MDRVGTRLLNEVAHGEVIVQAHQPVGGRVGHGNQGERRSRLGLDVLLDLAAEVDVAQHVAVEHQEALVEHRLGELQRARRSARLGLLDEP